METKEKNNVGEENKTKKDVEDKDRIKPIYYIVLCLLLLGIYICTVIYMRGNAHLLACVQNNNPFCYPDWLLKTDSTTDNTVPAAYANILKNKNVFLSTPLTTPVVGSNVLSSPPYTGCKDPSYDEKNNAYKTLNLDTDTLNYGQKPLSSFSGTTVSGLPEDTFFCKPTQTNPPLPSAFAS